MTILLREYCISINSVSGLNKGKSRKIGTKYLLTKKSMLLHKLKTIIITSRIVTLFNTTKLFESVQLLYKQLHAFSIIRYINQSQNKDLNLLAFRKISNEFQFPFDFSAFAYKMMAFSFRQNHTICRVNHKWNSTEQNCIRKCKLFQH